MVAAGAARPLGPRSQNRGKIRPRLGWVLALCALVPSARGATVTLKTEDGIRLAAEYAAPARGRAVLVLLHGLGAGKSEWAPFVASASARGFGALAFDARGHGDSGGPPFRTFTTPEHWLALRKDFAAAAAFLKKRGIGEDRLVLAGASVGASVALLSAPGHPRARAVLALSPGWAYQGLEVARAAAELDRPILFAAAPDDPYAWRSAERLAALARDPRSRFLRAVSGHGAGMLSGERNAAFVRELLEELERLTARPTSGGARASSPGP